MTARLKDSWRDWLLVASHISQWGGIDYEETFAPVAKFTSIRIVAAMVAHLDFE